MPSDPECHRGRRQAIRNKLAMKEAPLMRASAVTAERILIECAAKSRPNMAARYRIPPNVAQTGCSST